MYLGLSPWQTVSVSLSTMHFWTTLSWLYASCNSSLPACLVHYTLDYCINRSRVTGHVGSDSCAHVLHGVGYLCSYSKGGYFHLQKTIIPLSHNVRWKTPPHNCHSSWWWNVSTLRWTFSTISSYSFSTKRTDCELTDFHIYVHNMQHSQVLTSQTWLLNSSPNQCYNK